MSDQTTTTETGTVRLSGTIECEIGTPEELGIDVPDELRARIRREKSRSRLVKRFPYLG